MFVSRSSGETARLGACNRGAVEPIAALVALVAVGAALGLYAGALGDAAPDRERNLATPTLDRVERAATVGGVVDPRRLSHADLGSLPAATVELETRHETWRVRFGERAPTADARSSGVDVASRSVTVRSSPGENVRGTLRVVVRG
ncbi:DUF7285 family protein [Halorubrum sp. DTA98]|uniref:DUF7285 family protein n=1 Tax=Halorubrum sp. DTA98 TaxID=3402163 RepID=UPI003AAD5746